MLYEIIPQLVIVLSIVGIIVILGRKLPQVSNREVLVKDRLEKEKKKTQETLKYVLGMGGHFLWMFIQKSAQGTLALGRKSMFFFKERKKEIISRQESKEKVALQGKRKDLGLKKIPIKKVKISRKKIVPLQLKSRLKYKRTKKVLRPAFLERKVAPEAQWASEFLEDYQDKSIIELLTKASRLVRIEHLGEAETLCLDVIRRDPKNTQVYKILGDIYFQQSNTEDAENSFKEALRRGLSEVEIYKKLGLLYTEQGRTREAIKIYRRALKNKLAKEYFYLELGRIYRKKGEYDKAVQVYEDLVQEYPGNFKYVEILEKQKRLRN